MPRVFPFDGARYAPVAGPLARLTAPPYDVISDPRRRGYLEGSPHNIVHLDLAEGGEDPAQTDNRYARAAALLDGWRAAGVLRRDPMPHYYAYEMRFTLEGADHHTRGVVCALELEPWGAGVVPHEDTMPGPVEDRLRLLRATRTHLSPVYATIAGPCVPLATLLDELSGSEPAAEVTDGEHVRHRLWLVQGSAPIDRWLRDESLLIADGHHRYTTALAYREERHGVDGAGPWDRIMTLVVDSGVEHVPVLPYHRVQLGGPSPAGGEPAGGLADLLRGLDDTRLRYGTVTLDATTGGLVHHLHQLRGEPPTVAALHEQVLDAAAPGDALRFTHDAHDAEEAVRSGGATAAYLLPPTTPEHIRRVVRQGRRLPRKSTFFWPKPRTGMVLMPLDPPATSQARLNPAAGPPGA